MRLIDADNLIPIMKYTTTDKELDNLPDGDFKEFALNNFDLITNDEMNFFETTQAIKEREDELKTKGK